MVYKLLLIIWLKLFISCQQNDTNSSYINQKDFSIKNAVYIIRNREGNANLEYNPEIKFNNSTIKLKQNFEIIQGNNENNNSEIFYFIKDTYQNQLLSAQKDSSNLIKHRWNININYALWKITPKINEDNKLIYYIQNKKTGYYWELNSYNNSYILNLRNISNQTSLTKKNEFLFIELYEKVEIKKSELLEKEPIDVLIKYIDLNDEKLNRTGLELINKDYENGEIKYCVISILKNIPWIRKIFILMPNDEVKYFLPKEEISDKIVYVKDKDLLGFDSESCTVFFYHYFKMRQFGLSENFIFMDDDYFIAQPINKYEMFYEENGKIYPAIVTSDYYEMDKNLINRELLRFKRKLKKLDPHSPIAFQITQKNSKLFLYDIFGNDETRFGKTLIEPAFTHNAFPAKLSDIEEIYNYLYNNMQLRNTLLKSKKRSVYDLQFQTLYWCYVKNKYGRKTFIISSQFYDLSESFRVFRNTKKLFVINTSSQNYKKEHYLKEKKLLEKLFPIKTKYERDFDKIKRQKDIQKITDAIKKSIMEKINKQMNLNSAKYEISFDNEILIKNLRKHLNDDIDYKSIIKEEIKNLKIQCFWQEILNGIFSISFLILIIYRYIDIRRNRI